MYKVSLISYVVLQNTNLFNMQHSFYKYVQHLIQYSEFHANEQF